MKVFLSFLLLISAVASSYGHSLAQQQTPILKPQLTVGEVQFALQLLNRVTLQGNEVEAFLEVQKTLQQALQKAIEAKKGVQDTIELALPLPIAQNLLAFMQRAQLTGSEAPIFKQITDKIIQSAQQQQSQNASQGQ